MILKQSHKYQGNLHKFDFEVNSKEECNFFISSDWHWDNVKCNRELLKSHLDKAMEIGAFIVVTGDMLCLMQGKYDKRSSKSAVRPEHNATNYLDVVINDCANYLRPYAKNILLISEGNHETSVSERHETRVLERLVERVNTLEGTNIQLGNYTGYYKYVVDSGEQIVEFWFDFFYPSRKWSHTVLSSMNDKNPSPMIYNFKCRKFKN